MGNLFNDTTTEKTVLVGSSEKYGFDAVPESLIGVRHLQFLLEVGENPQAAQQHPSLASLGVFHGQPRIAIDFDAAQMLRTLANLLHPFGDGKQRRLFRVAGHGDNNPLEQPTPSLDDIEMAESNRIETAGIDGDRRGVAHLKNGFGDWTQRSCSLKSCGCFACARRAIATRSSCHRSAGLAGRQSCFRAGVLLESATEAPAAKGKTGDRATENASKI